MNDSESTVFILDDDVSVCQSIGDLLEAAGFRVRAYSTPQKLIQHIRVSGPLCLLLDVYLAGASGLDVQQELLRAEISAPIIFLSGKSDIPISVRAMKAGAVEFLTKPFSDEVLLAAVREALDRDRVVHRQRRDLAMLRQRFALLTPREVEVMKLVVSGKLNKEAAASLGTQVITVKIQRSRVMRKMAATSFAELVRMALQLGISAG